jgi:hypothetical protein
MTNTARKLLLGLLGGGSGDPPLPFSDNFNRANGALGANWNAPTYTIVSNAATNAPTPGADLFDPGTGTFDSGVNSWVAAGSNTVENVDGKLKITYVNNDGGAAIVLWDATVLTSNFVPSGLYVLDYEAYREGGSFLFYMGNGAANFYHTVNNTLTLVGRRLIFLARATSHTLSTISMAAGEIAWLDNLVLRRLTPAEVFGFPASAARQFSGDVIVRALMTVATGDLGGVFCKLDSSSNPQNYIMAFITRDSNAAFQMYKVVGGVTTSLVLASANANAGTYRDGAMLEIRTSGTSVEMWYDGAICGTTQTVSDAAIVSGTMHGQYISGSAAQSGAFGLIQGTSTLGILAFVGGSITWSPTPGWRLGTLDALQTTHIDTLLPGYLVATNGQTAWEHLVRLASEVVARNATMVFVDLAANHGSTDYDKGTCEAYIRKLRTALPNATILMPLFATWASGAATDPSNQTVINWLITLAEHYDVGILNIAATMDALRDLGTNALTDWYTTPDWTHPNAAGYAFITAQMLPLLTESYLAGGGTPWTGDIADYARLYTETASWEATPQARNGTDNDGETGTWTTVTTTSRRSTVATSTISWTATCQSFGLDVVIGSGAIEWDVDGGGWTALNLATHPRAITFISALALGAHTITIRVTSGTVTINRFLAI